MEAEIDQIDAADRTAAAETPLLWHELALDQVHAHSMQSNLEIVFVGGMHLADLISTLAVYRPVRKK